MGQVESKKDEFYYHDQSAPYDVKDDSIKTKPANLIRDISPNDTRDSTSEHQDIAPDNSAEPQQPTRKEKRNSSLKSKLGKAEPELSPNVLKGKEKEKDCCSYCCLEGSNNECNQIGCFENKNYQQHQAVIVPYDDCSNQQQPHQLNDESPIAIIDPSRSKLKRSNFNPKNKSYSRFNYNSRDVRSETNRDEEKERARKNCNNCFPDDYGCNNHETTFVVGYNKQTGAQVPVATLTRRLNDDGNYRQVYNYNKPNSVVNRSDNIRTSDDGIFIESQRINSPQRLVHSGGHRFKSLFKSMSSDCTQLNGCALCLPPIAKTSVDNQVLMEQQAASGGLCCSQLFSVDSDHQTTFNLEQQQKRDNKNNVSNNKKINNVALKREHIIESLKATTRAIEKELETFRAATDDNDNDNDGMEGDLLSLTRLVQQEQQKTKDSSKSESKSKSGNNEEIYKCSKADGNESYYDVNSKLPPDTKQQKQESRESDFFHSHSRLLEFNNQLLQTRPTADTSTPNIFGISDINKLSENYSSSWQQGDKTTLSYNKKLIEIQNLLAIQTKSDLTSSNNSNSNNEKNCYNNNHNKVLDNKRLLAKENHSTQLKKQQIVQREEDNSNTIGENNLSNNNNLKNIIQTDQTTEKKNKEKEELKRVTLSASNNNNNNYTEQYPINLDWNGLAKRYGKMPRRQEKGQFWWRIRQSCLCDTFLSTIYTLFPILISFSSYSIPGDLVTDIVAGFTIAVLHIPQGMAYGILAGVEPIHGLYVSFVPVLVMAFMSKSRHVSYGTFAVISMLLASTTDSVKVLLQQQMVASMAAAAAAASSSGGSSANELVKTKQAPNTVGGSGGIVVTNNHRPPESNQQILKNLIPSFIDDTSEESPQQRDVMSSFFHVQQHQPTGTGSGSGSGNIFALPAGLNYDDFVMPSNIEILTCVCIVVGVIQIIMALMRLGSLSLMFSDQLVSSFTTASAIHVVTSQLGPLFDLNMPPIPDGIFKVCRTWWVFGTQLMNDFNQYTAILTVISIIFLLCIKEIFEPLLRKRYKSMTCLPSELVLMALVIFSSWFWKFNDKYNIRIIGNVPTGLPALQYPRVDLMPLVLQDALTIALVSFAMNLSLGQVYAKKYRYTLNPNQELFALGSSNLISSFFSCFPCASSLSRSAVQSNLNAKSQLCSLFSCAIVVSIICYFAPILHDLPRSTLSCIIIIALRGILVQVTDLYENWRLSKLDAFVWVLTFLSVIIFGVTYGLVLGIVASLFMIFFRLLTPNHSILGQLPGTEIYIDKNAFLDCEEINQIKIFRFNSALCYLNRTMFKSSVEKSLPSIYNKQNGFSNLFCPSSSSKTKKYYNHTDNGNSHLENDKKIKFLVIDCSALAYCDYSGAATLVEIIEELEEQKVTVYLAACPLKLINMIEKMQKSRVLEQNVYPTITDAVNHAKYLKNCTSQSLTCVGSSNLSNYNDPNCLRSVLEGDNINIREDTNIVM